MITVGQMVMQLQGLVGTKDISPKNEQFIIDMKERTVDGKRTSHLTTGQIDYIESLWRQHFG